MREIKCTVVIPTYNRPNHLKRILDYYHQYGTGLPLLIADSSSEENKKLNQETVASFHNVSSSYLDKYAPNTHPSHKILDALQQVNTEYCVLCADDDFVTPRGIQESIDFLEISPDFTTAYGNYVTFRIDLVSGSGPKLSYRQYHSQSNTRHEPGVRLIDEVANNYKNSGFFYAVSHTNFKQKIFTEASKIISQQTNSGAFKQTSDAFFAELIVYWLSVIYGKVKCLDTLFCAREDYTPAHLRRTYVTLEDLIDEVSYKENKREFSNCVQNHLSKQSGISLTEASKIVDNAIAIFMKRNQPLIHKISKNMNDLNLPDWLDNGIRKLYRALFLYPSQRINSLPWKYYPDYNQIYLTILAHASEVYGPIITGNC